MPGGDGTGPNGQGPMTGRGAGYCAGYASPGFANPGFGRGRFWRGRGAGRGFGRGAGFGRGFRWRAFASVYPNYYFYDEPVALTEAEEKKVLEQEIKELREEMKQVEKRLKELNSAKSK